MKLQQNIKFKEGWKAELDLSFAPASLATVKPNNVRTVMQRSHHHGPLRVQRPFYPEDNVAHIYILHPPGGVVGGDQLTIKLDILENAQVLSTTPGSGKFYCSVGDWARLEQTLMVKAGASLEWLPQENILFAGACLHATTKIKVEDDGVFIGWDITCLGRPTSHERFEQGGFFAQLEFYHNQQLILVENQRVFDKQTLDATAGLRGQPLQATLLAFPCTEADLECVRTQLSSKQISTLIGASLMDGLLVIRALADNSELLKQQLIQLWQTLRPLLLDRASVIPRIWAT